MVLKFLYICNRLWHSAQMVKLVDTPASGAGGRKLVKVQVLFSAPLDYKEYKKTRKLFSLAGFLLLKSNFAHN